MSAINFRQNIRRRLEFRLEKYPKTPKLQAKHQGAELEFRLICGKTCGNAVHFAVQNAAFGPNMRQNMRQRRSFRRTLVRSPMKKVSFSGLWGKLGQICLIMLEKGTFRRLFNRANRAPLTNRAYLKMT